MTRTTEGRHRERHDPHWIEWLTGCISALLVTAMIGWIAYEAVTRQETPPELVVTAGRSEVVAGGYRVPFEISNRAPTTAANVMIIGRLAENGRTIEESQVLLDYVAAESRSAGALLFAENPAGRTLDIRPVGYTDP